MSFWFSVQAAASGQTAALSGTGIYDRAREIVAARALPTFVAFTQSVAFVRHGRRREQIDQVVVRLADSKTNITPLGAPPTAARVEDRPLLSPLSVFGLARPRAGEQPSTFEVEPPQEPSTAVIGRVSATSRAYDARLDGVETIDGAPVYHLVMVPRFDPQRNRIRALFVDTQTFEPRRIAIEYFAARGPLRSRPTVTFDYAPVGGIWVITHAAMNFVVRFGPFAYGGSGEFRATDVSFPTAEPAWMFDRKALAKHLAPRPMTGSP
jgi:hypothetical protein